MPESSSSSHTSHLMFPIYIRERHRNTGMGLQGNWQPLSVPYLVHVVLDNCFSASGGMCSNLPEVKSSGVWGGVMFQ